MVNNHEHDDIPLISIIVPIYNVAPWLRKCLDSLKNQTLRQIEVIMIDDGSLDQSGQIADDYISDDWPIFRCIHTENKGLSAARNRGIDESIADWIMFVDSDDWVDERFCEIPYEAVIVNNADMAVFGYKFSFQNGKPKRTKEGTINIDFSNYETIIDTSGSAAWNKIYRKQLFDHIRYPEGFVFEEIGTTHKLIYASKRIVCCKEKLYTYRLRKGSICHSVSNEEDRLVMSYRRYVDLVNLGYSNEKAKSMLSASALRCCGRVSSVDTNIYKEAARILDEIDGLPYGLSPKEMCMLIVWRLNRNIYRMIYKALMRVIRL